MSLYLVSSSRLPSWLAMAAAFFNMAYDVIISRGMRSLPMLKCSSERWVCAPHNLSAGTLTSPRLSVSLRTSATAHLMLICRDTSRLVVRRHAAKRLQRAVPLLVVEPLALAGLRRPGLLARHRRAGGGADQRDQTLERFLAVALLAALALRHQHQHAVARQPPAGQPFQALAHVMGQRGRMTHVEAQLHGRRRLVDVLTTWPGRAHEALLDLGRIDRQRAGNPDRRGPVDRRRHHSRPPARRSMASIVGRPDWRA